MMENEDPIVVPKSQLANLFSLPEEVLINCIFPNIGYEDLLRLRRVCKYLKSFSDSFIRLNFKSYVREINEANYKFQHYLQTNLSTTSIYINNSSPSIFQDPDIPSFLNLHGDQITHLKINHFATFTSEHELNFFSNLPNLLHLDINFIDASSRDCTLDLIGSDDDEFGILRESCPFPQNFKNLKTLKLNAIQGSNPSDNGYPWDFLFFCQNLEYFKHPTFDKTVARSAGISTPFGEGGPFGSVIEYMRRFPQNNLKFYDLDNFQQDHSFYQTFCTLVEHCYEHDTKLLNVPGQLLACVWDHFGNTPEKYGRALVSLLNAHGSMFCTELINLEKLTVESIWQSTWMEPLTWREGRGQMPKWPSLKSLDIMVDTMQMTGFDPGNGDFECCSLELVDFLFPGEKGSKRVGVTDLAIRSPKRGDYNGMLEEDDDVEFPVFVGYVKRITETCPFVKKLTLTSWETWCDTGLKASGFWEGLQFLEEVEVDDCSKLEDVAFVGNDWEDPAFLKLKHLKKLVIKEVNRMNLTDKAFEKVFRNLKVKEFRLTSSKPVKSITVTGIECLLTGEFNNYVEKFPFAGWSLDGISEKEFNKLKMRFRASHLA